MQINIKVFYKLILSFWVFVSRDVQSTQNKKLAYLAYLYRLQINAKAFYKVIVLVLGVCVARHAQNTQNNKFLISFQYPKKNGRMKLLFCLQVNMKGFSIVMP